MGWLEIGIVLILAVTTSTSGSDPQSKCSCYVFYGNSSDWQNSRRLCEAIGGDLVSIETLKEWDFIVKQLGSKTTDTSANQWWIGLERKNGIWKWLSNQDLKYTNKWPPNLNVDENIAKYAVIDKSTGLFWKARVDVGSGKICELKRKDCSSNQTQWCDVSPVSTAPTQQTTLSTQGVQSTTVAAPANITTAGKKPTIFPSTRQQKSTPEILPSKDEEKDQRSVRPKKKPFPFLIVVIVLSVVLFICIGILIVVWIWKSKRKGKHRIGKQRKESDNVLDVPLSVRHMYDQYPHEDEGKKGDAISPDEPGFTFFTQNKNITVHRETTKNAKNQAPRIVAVDAQINTQGPTTGVENGNVVQEKEVKVKRKVKEKVWNNVEEKGEVKEKKKVKEKREVKENVGNEVEEKDEMKEKREVKKKSNDETRPPLVVPAKLTAPQSRHGDELEDEVFYPNENLQENASQHNIAELESAPQCQGLPDNTTPFYANDENKETPLYAEIKDVTETAEREDQAKDITYAELTEFNANPSEPLKKPTPYYPTEYASVTLHPLSPREFER